MLDPLAKLARRGFEVTLLPVMPSPDPRAGLIRLEQLAAAIRDDTILVSIMLANNEIGAIQPLAEIGRLCKQRGVLLHTDATQAVGKIPVDVEALGVDLMSFTAHKIYGPKGDRRLVRSRAAARAVRLRTADRRRRAGRRTAERHGQRAGHRRFRPGPGALPGGNSGRSGPLGGLRNRLFRRARAGLPRRRRSTVRPSTCRGFGCRAI